MRSYFILFEVVTAVSMFGIILMQRPGVPTEKFAKKHGWLDLQQRREIAAENAERQFAIDHPFAARMCFRAGGILFWGAGLCFVIVSAPISTDSVRLASVSLGLVVQAVATIVYVGAGLMASRAISRAVHAVEGEKPPRK
jgi:hypothetical protein